MEGLPEDGGQPRTVVRWAEGLERVEAWGSVRDRVGPGPVCRLSGGLPMVKGAFSRPAIWFPSLPG